MSKDIVLSSGAVALLGHRARRKVLAVEELGGGCIRCPHTGLVALRIAFVDDYSRLPKQLDAYKVIIKNPEEAELKYEVICLNCLEEQRAILKAEALDNYEAMKMTALHNRCLKVFNDAIAPIWDGETPLRGEDIRAALEKSGRRVDRKTMYRYLTYLVSAEIIMEERDPADLRRKLYTLPFPPKNTMFARE